MSTEVAFVSQQGDITAEQVVQQHIEKDLYTVQHIQGIVNRYKEISVDPSLFANKEHLEVVKAAHAELKKSRTSLEKVVDEKKRIFEGIKKRIAAAEKERLDIITPVEGRLKQFIDAAKAAEEREKSKLVDDRLARFVDLGATTKDGVVWSAGGVFFTKETIAQGTELSFTAQLNAAKEGIKRDTALYRHAELSKYGVFLTMEELSEMTGTKFQMVLFDAQEAAKSKETKAPDAIPPAPEKKEEVKADLFSGVASSPFAAPKGPTPNAAFLTSKKEISEKAKGEMRAYLKTFQMATRFSVDPSPEALGPLTELRAELRKVINEFIDKHQLATK